MRNYYLITSLQLLILGGCLLDFGPSYSQSTPPKTAVTYIAIGGSLSAGVQDGGISQSSQLTSFPNLLARQIGATEFRQPLFEGEFQNGSGTHSAFNKKGVLTFTEAKKPAFSTRDNLPKVTGIIHNFALPYLKVRESMIPEDQPGAFLLSFEKASYQHLNRFARADQEGKLSYLAMLQEKEIKPDFFTFELGMDDFVDYFRKGGYGEMLASVTEYREGYYPENNLIRLLHKKGAKGVIANVPDVLAMPFFNFYKYDDIVALVGDGVFIQWLWKNDLRLIDPRDKFIPSQDLADLVQRSGKGLRADNPLLDENVLSYNEVGSVEFYNAIVAEIATSNKLPVVDLYGLYKKIQAGGYVTDDGLKIDPSYPGGNFFSADGIFPTAAGQAVIANEFIKTFNRHYGTTIELIRVSDIR
ncbi:hypothetical protein GCM10023091_40140 [Ravibacter arvi]|uniref:SGNH/GDSL hydrolase family protein n=1 Tax=Ravibacter arvi TaxID=2051041 RepID=A0ABP8M9S7_9BACT